MELCEIIKLAVPEFYFVEAKVGADPDQRNYIVSNLKIENTGFMPEMTLDRGIRELVKGYKMINNRVYGNV